MAKKDFNVTFTDEFGETIQQPKLDKKKITTNGEGRIIQHAQIDADGNVVHEDVKIKDLIARTLNSNFPGDDALPFADRVARGKLARKVADATKGSLKNYTTEELQLIKDLLAKGQAIPLLAAQVDEIIEGTDEVTAAPEVA